jgi:hypothetical protein
MGPDGKLANLSLRTILAVVTLVTILVTATIVHVSWLLTARAEVDREADREQGL